MFRDREKKSWKGTQVWNPKESFNELLNEPLRENRKKP